MVEHTVVDVIVISQVPPPVHGSTVMTKTFLEMLRTTGRRSRLVDRRFSKSVDEIGTASFRKVLGAFSLLGRLWLALRRSPSADVVFFTTNRPPSFWVDVAMSVVLRTLRRRYIAYVHTSGYADLAGAGTAQRRGVRLLLGGAASVVVLGTSMRADVQRFNGTVRTIPNTVAESMTPAARAAAAPSIVFVSNLIPGKGADEFMRIANRCLRDVPAARAVVVGRAPTTEYEDELRAILEPDVRTRVMFAGPLFDADRDAVVASASVLVFPSSYRYEAQPLTVLEALRLGVPVVAYAVGGLGDVIDDDVNGYLVATGDREAAADRCRSIMTSPDLRKRLGAGARAVSEERFAPARYAAAWSDLLEGRD